MAATLLFLLLSILSVHAIPNNQSNERGFISAVISEKGLEFVKDLLINQALLSLTPLTLPKIQKDVKIPVIGGVQMSLTNITIYSIDVSSSYISPGDSGITIVVSGATANLSMNWRYSYSTWLLPIEISDKGQATVQVEGMEVGLTINMENQEGTLKLALMECGCYLEDMSITLNGGASWLYQGLVDAFEGQIRSAVENAIMKKIAEGILKLDALLQKLPKTIPVDDIAALNVTFVDDPLLGNYSVGFEINGLFTSTNEVAVPSYYRISQSSVSCNGPLKMLMISLDEAVFNSASVTYFEGGIMQWIVDKVPDQSILNTAYWKFIIPQLYKKYPNDDMTLNISLTSPPSIRITPDNFDATIFSDMTVDILDANKTVPVACISVVISASASLEIAGNNLAGEAELDNFTLNLKWSKVGNFHMYLIQGLRRLRDLYCLCSREFVSSFLAIQFVQTLMRVFLKDVLLPAMNLRLKKGFPLPIIRGFALRNADILCTHSKIVVCSDVVFNGSWDDLKQLPVYY